MKERLQKILARAGVASRRAAEALIVAGRVRVNGRIVTELGVTADPRHDRVDVDGKRIVREPLVYLLFHKPRGMVATMKDPEGRPAIGEVVEKIGVRVVPVGRLDFHTSGALLLTNDGEMIDALLHPKREVPKVYIAKMRGSIDVKELDLLRNGVVLDDGEKTRPANAFVHREEAGQSWVELTLYEGKNRQIHRMGDAIGHPVLRLARLSFAGIGTEGLRPGQWRPLDARELERLVKDWVTPRRQSDHDAGRAMRVDEPRFERGGDDDDRELEAPPRPTRGARAASSARGPGRGPPSRAPSGPSRAPSGPSRVPASRAPSGPLQGPGRVPASRASSGPSRGPGRGPPSWAPSGPPRGPGRVPASRAPSGPSRGPGRGPPSWAPSGPPRGAGRGPERAASGRPGAGSSRAAPATDARRVGGSDRKKPRGR